MLESIGNIKPGLQCHSFGFWPTGSEEKSLGGLCANPTSVQMQTNAERRLRINKAMEQKSRAV
jgi:hypothetical protein